MGRIGMIVFLLVLSLGCHPAPTPSSNSSPEIPALATSFDPAATGDIEGHVTWQGALPDVADLIVNVPGFPTRNEPNPNKPSIAQTGAIANSLVFLREVDLSKARHWDHLPVRVKATADKLVSEQGDKTARIGIVRQGASVSFENTRDAFTSITARGESFFSLPFTKPTANQRSLATPGMVELSTTFKDYWHRAHLFVSPHPYVALTDEKGHFRMPQVPTGAYEIVCLLPSWHIIRKETDPERRCISSIVFAEPISVSQDITVIAGQTTMTRISLKDSPFPTK